MDRIEIRNTKTGKMETRIFKDSDEDLMPTGSLLIRKTQISTLS